jgi:DNA-binding NtrC family response regulator
MELEQKIEKLQTLKILFAEDEPDLLEIIEKTMKKLDVNYITAVDGKDALEKYNTNSDIDLIVTDINMDHLNGIELINEIKKIDDTLPIIIMSAHSEDKYFNIAEELNIPYLLKPLVFSEFLDIVGEMDFNKA